MDYWKDRTALVTGAGSGIGRALAAALGARGAFVVASDLDGAAAADAARAIPAGTPVTLDVRDAAAFAAVVSQIVRDRGRLDFLFGNAGTGVAGETQELTRAHWDRVLDVNLYGVINGILAAYPVMVRQRSGHIVNVASLAGLGAAPFLVPYAASKHAVVGLSRSLRAEAVDHGVRVSVLCPAAVETPLLDRGNPSDLPAISWTPNMRRYLENLAGPPISPDAFAQEALRGVERNRAVIVIPARARLAARLDRVAPGMVERLVLRAVRLERKPPA